MVAGKLKAKDIMTPWVFTVRPADLLWKVIDLICRHRVSGVPVLDGQGRLVGLISERDILHAMYCGSGAAGDGPGKGTAGRLRNVDALAARDIMVRDVITAAPDTDALRLASIMALRKIRRIPIVVDKKLVGIVSHGDVYRAMFGMRGKAIAGKATPMSAGPVDEKRTAGAGARTKP